MTGWYGSAVIVALTVFSGTDALGETTRDTISVCARPVEGFLAVKEDGPIGLEYDLLAGFAEATGRAIDLRFIESFPQVLTSVASGECDVGAATITITEDRGKTLDFSTTYFPGRSVVVEPAGQHRAVKGIDGLVGSKVAAIPGTLHETITLQHEGIELYHAVDDPAMWQSVADGKADALICDAWQTLHFAEQFPDLKVTASLSDRTDFGFAFPKGATLRDEFDRYFQVQRDDGTYRDLLVHHFGEWLAASLLDEP